MPGLDVSAHADAFSLLSHDDRLAAVAAIFSADREWVPFSTLRDWVGVEDTGRLHYHLSRLTPRFVERSPDGYRLTRRGSRAARVVHRCSLTADPDKRVVDLDHCVRCGGSLVLTYTDQFGTVGCRDCGRWFVRHLLPPAAVASADDDGVVTLLDNRCRELRRAGNRGVCPLCSGSMDRELVADASKYGHDAHVAYDCRDCECHFTSTVGATHAEHAAVVAFSHEHDVDVTARPLWTLPFAFDPERLAVLDSDAPRVELALSHGDDALRLTVGPDGDVTAVDHA